VLLETLSRVCGSLPDDVEQRVRRLPVERMKQLGRALFDFDSLHDLLAWLGAHEEPA
jgi:hypothetical protein